ncbi:MAG: RNA-binding protein [Oscillospiraceae bacterium]|nr:RNA-binding protein [Oscillospiraceae bacterium]
MRGFPEIRCEITDEERILLSHAEDMINGCDRDYTPRFSQFLDERQAMLIKMLLDGRHIDKYRFFGGYEGAVRTMLCIYPEYCEPENKDYPITAVRFSFREQDHPTHSQFLGTIMSLQIKRSMVGDIIVGNGCTDVFLTGAAADSAMFIEKVGRVGVKPAVIDGTGITREDDFEELSASVSSLRLDCVASAAIKLSRDKTSAFIRSEGIELNHCRVYAPDKILEYGDVFSVRGHGKFILSEIGGRSRRDRIFITLKKYR